MTANLAASRGAAARATSQCLSADSTSASLINYVTELIRTTNPQLAALRDSIGLGGVSPSSLALVSDDSTCARAASALDELAHVSHSGRLVYVVQAGPGRFVVMDPDATAGEHTTVWVFDSRFRLVRALLR